MEELFEVGEVRTSIQVQCLPWMQRRSRLQLLGYQLDHALWESPAAQQPQLSDSAPCNDYGFGCSCHWPRVPRHLPANEAPTLVVPASRLLVTRAAGPPSDQEATFP